MMAFLVGATAGALGVLAVQRILDELGIESAEELLDRVDEHLEELEGRLEGALEVAKDASL